MAGKNLQENRQTENKISVKRIFKKSRKEKTCRDYRAMITPFLRGETGYEKNGELLSHIEQCEACYDELRTTYMVMEGLKRLESGQGFNLGDDFGQMLDEAKSDYENIRSARSIFGATVICAFALSFVVLLFGII